MFSCIACFLVHFRPYGAARCVAARRIASPKRGVYVHLCTRQQQCAETVPTLSSVHMLLKLNGTQSSCALLLYTDGGGGGTYGSRATNVLRQFVLFCTPAVSPGEGVRAWSDAIGEAFLDPFAVGAHSSSVTTLGTRGRVHERVVQEAPSIPFLTAGTQDRCAYDFCTTGSRVVKCTRRGRA
jgi:hypothetical protein